MTYLNITMKTILIPAFVFLVASTASSQTDSCKYRKTNFPNGNLKEEGCIKNGEKDGVWKEYEEEGYLSFIWTYKNGLKDGPYKALYPNGKPKAIGQWKKGCIVDSLKSYDENGDLTEVVFWVANKSLGSSTSTYRKVYNKNTKPDGTVEKIDGKDYLWMGNEKHELHYNNKPADPVGGPEKASENSIYAIVDKMPLFAEGKDELKNFVKKNVHYPEKSQSRKIEGTVFSSFVIEKNGEISNIKILKGLDEFCNEEVIRVIKLMPKWTPAQKANQNVRYQLNLPISFTLPK